MKRRHARLRGGVSWLAVLGLLAAACGSSSGTPAPSTPTSPTRPAPTSAESTPPNALSLDEALDRIGPAGAGIDPRTTFQDIAGAITATGRAGTTPEAISRTVTVALVRNLLLPNGPEGIVYSDDFVNGNAAPITSGSRTADAGRPQAAHAGGMTAQVAAADPEVVFYYVNGVLNTQSQALASANLIASRLGRHLQRSITVKQVYNASSISPGMAMLDGCAAAAELDPNAPAADLVGAVCQSAKICATPGLLAATAWDSISKSFPQLVLQKSVDPDFASNPVNTELERMVREDVAAGRKVLIVSHSQGTLFVRNVLGRLADVGKGNVGGFYISPAFGQGDDLRTPATGFVLLKGDAMSITGVSGATTTEPSADQQGSPLNLHYIDTYLKDGTPSLQVFLDGVSSLLKNMGAKGIVNRSLGAASVMQPVVWRQPGAATIRSAATNCAPAPSVTPTTGSASSSAGAGAFSVSLSGFINATIGPDWGTGVNPDCQNVGGSYWTVGGGGLGPDGQPYLWEVTMLEAPHPGTFKGPQISAVLQKVGTGYSWAAYRPATGSLSVNDGLASGSFSFTLAPDRYNPAASGEVSMAGTFRCAAAPA